MEYLSFGCQGEAVHQYCLASFHIVSSIDTTTPIATTTAHHAAKKQVLLQQLLLLLLLLLLFHYCTTTACRNIRYHDSPAEHFLQD